MTRVNRKRNGKIDLNEFLRLFQVRQNSMFEDLKEPASTKFMKQNPSYNSLRTGKAKPRPEGGVEEEPRIVTEEEVLEAHEEERQNTLGDMLSS
jgi:hypothetical protein